MSKILVAEDNAVNRELMREMLEVFGCEVVEAGDGPEALTRMDEVEPDLILLDINMPKLNGFAVLKGIRENPRFSERPVLAVTAYAMREDRDKALQAGFDGYLAKPLDRKLLLAELRRFGVVTA
jgi:two-component system cell cycle response regulator DivK